LVSVIATDTEAKAKAASNELKQGKSFADVARTSSLDSTGQVGGLLGCLNENTLPGELQSAAETVPLNVVTVPIVTNGGAYLVYVQPFDTLKTSPGASSVVALIAGAGMNARFKSMDHVKINPRFGSWGLVQSQRGVQTAVKPPPIPNPANARNTTTTTVPASALAPQGG
jgi:hypothetical protein